MNSFGWSLEHPQPTVFNTVQYGIATQMAVVGDNLNEDTMIFVMPVDGVTKPSWFKLSDTRPMTGGEFEKMQQTGASSASKLVSVQ